MSKYILIHNPQSLPNQCAGCGTTTIGEGWIDTALHAEFFGTIYLCKDCIMEMASQYGKIADDRSKEKINELIGEKEELKNDLKEILEQLGGILEDYSRPNEN